MNRLGTGFFWIEVRGTNRESPRLLEVSNSATRRSAMRHGRSGSKTPDPFFLEIITSYAKGIEQAGEFYTFVRTLEAYKKALGNDTRLILTTDSEFFRLLKEIGKAEPVSPHPESPPVRSP